MKLKFNRYYEKEMIYEVSLQELLERKKDIGYFEEEWVLAYIRKEKENAIFNIPFSVLNKSFFFKEQELKEMLPCQICTEKDDDLFEKSMYNPIINDESFELSKNWYFNYKIGFRSIEDKLINRLFYITDFIIMLNDNRITIKEN